MRRLLALIVLALSLAVASGPAFATTVHDCPMTESQPMPVNHEDMGCCEMTCAPDCAVVCPAAVEPSLGGDLTPANVGEKLLARPADALRSAFLTGADPPPRTTFS